MSENTINQRLAKLAEVLRRYGIPDAEVVAASAVGPGSGPEEGREGGGAGALRGSATAR